MSTAFGPYAVARVSSGLGMTWEMVTLFIGPWVQEVTPGGHKNWAYGCTVATGLEVVVRPQALKTNLMGMCYKHLLATAPTRFKPCGFKGCLFYLHIGIKIS